MPDLLVDKHTHITVFGIKRGGEQAYFCRREPVRGILIEEFAGYVYIRSDLERKIIFFVVISWIICFRQRFYLIFQHLIWFALCVSKKIFNAMDKLHGLFDRF